MAHVKKFGFSDSKVIDARKLLDNSNEDIAATIQNAKKEAIVTAITELRMSVKEGKWKLQSVSADDDDDDECINDTKESTIE